MKQLTQKLGSGEMTVQEVPIPQLAPNMILVKNHYSVISAGTEGSTVSTARKGMIAKAKERPEQVKQVIATFKSQGPVSTYRAVTKKLDAYSPLGYSSSGEVIEVGEQITEFAVGDFVACAGVGYANHAEVIAVPRNLAVKLDSPACMRDAAYNTLGAIAMQGVRQADLRLGESCAVIGLGLLGQITCSLLKASGIRVVGVDIDVSTVETTRKAGIVAAAYNRNEAGIETKVIGHTDGHGVDAVIITAATDSLDPINFAGAIARKKGKVVVVGAVPTGFNRDPHWYRKELELKMACSYGPGRYDLNYEEKGIDYPLPYVRWTEKRNMQAFQQLLVSKAVNLQYLTTHEFAFEQAADAYDLILNRQEAFLGIALKYPIEKTHKREPLSITQSTVQDCDVSVSFIGAGSYAQGNLLPNIPSRIKRIAVMTNSGTSSKRVAERFQFQIAAAHEDDILKGEANTVFIATRHDSHGELVKRALEAGKFVFVEKPLCLKPTELQNIRSLVLKTGSSVMVGFNRRFSPFAKKLKQQLASNRVSMVYRVNAGSIPADSWIQDPDIGGGRVVGEVCHFIDFMIFMSDSTPKKVQAFSMKDDKNLNDTLNVSIEFKNGSVGVINYLSNGNKSLQKEYFEIHSSGISAVLNDFKTLTVHGKGKPRKTSLLNQNKGQKEMMESFISSLENSQNLPIPFEETYLTTLACFGILESLRQGGAAIELAYDN